MQIEYSIRSEFAGLTISMSVIRTGRWSFEASGHEFARMFVESCLYFPFRVLRLRQERFEPLLASVACASGR
jgi:hypothetical protein